MRAEYNSLLPSIPNYEQKVYHIKRKGSESLGITVRGGFEFGCGIFVSSVQPSSRALQAGLKVSLFEWTPLVWPAIPYFLSVALIAHEQEVGAGIQEQN